jgi:hypothetical protein
MSTPEESTSKRGFGDVDSADGRSRCCTGAPAVLPREGERTSYASFKTDGGSSDFLRILFSFALDFFPLHSVAHSILPRSVPRIVAASYPLFFFGVSFAQESDEFSNPILRPSFDESLLSPPLPLRSSRGASSRGLTNTPTKIDCGSSGALSPQDLNLFAFDSRILNSRILIYSPDYFIIRCGFGSRDLEPWWIWFLHAAALPVLVCTGAACHSSHVC